VEATRLAVLLSTSDIYELDTSFGSDRLIRMLVKRSVVTKGVSDKGGSFGIEARSYFDKGLRQNHSRKIDKGTALSLLGPLRSSERNVKQT
jgi:hypothetical protein